MFFDPAVYSVPEGENQVLVLRTDNEFAIPFTIDVTLRDGTAVGKYLLECISSGILRNTVYVFTVAKHSCAVGRRFQLVRLPGVIYHSLAS